MTYLLDTPYKERLSVVIQAIRAYVWADGRVNVLDLIIEGVPVNAEKVSYNKASVAIAQKLEMMGIKEFPSYQSLQQWETGDYANEISNDSAYKLGLFIGLEPKETAGEVLQGYLKGHRSLDGEVKPDATAPPKLPELQQASVKDALIWLRYGTSVVNLALNRLDAIKGYPKIALWINENIPQPSAGKVRGVVPNFKERFWAIARGEVDDDQLEEWEYDEIAVAYKASTGDQMDKDKLIKVLARYNPMGSSDPTPSTSD